MPSLTKNIGYLTFQFEISRNCKQDFRTHLYSAPQSVQTHTEHNPDHVRPSLKIIPLTIYLVPSSQSVSIWIKPILMTINNLPTGFIISSLSVSVLLTVFILIPSVIVLYWSNYKSCFKHVPGVLCVIVKKDWYISSLSHLGAELRGPWVCYTLPSAPWLKKWPFLSSDHL